MIIDRVSHPKQVFGTEQYSKVIILMHLDMKQDLDP